MLVDESGLFITQRTFPKLAKIQLSMTASGLELTYPGLKQLKIGLYQTDGKSRQVTVWRDSFPAASVGQEADNWFSQLLGIPVSLVAMMDDSCRQLDQKYARDTDQTGFADGFPFLLIGRSSLEDLNSRVGQKLSMRRFRPNLVVSESEPYVEDQWRHITIGNIGFRVVKPCSRCVITTIDPYTAEKMAEPLKTLAGYRKVGNEVYFGQNLIHDQSGLLVVGMKVMLDD